MGRRRARLICVTAAVAALLGVAVLLSLRPPAANSSLPESREHPAPSPVTSGLLKTSGNFTLFVTNQSFAIDPVDVHVEIDGQLVVNDSFPVGDAHHFVPFQLSLAKGQHRMRVWSERGGATLSEVFTLNNEDIGVVTYWYSPPPHYEPAPRQFDFELRKGPLHIE